MPENNRRDSDIRLNIHEIFNGVITASLIAMGGLLLGVNNSNITLTERLNSAADKLTYVYNRIDAIDSRLRDMERTNKK